MRRYLRNLGILLIFMVSCILPGRRPYFLFLSFYSVVNSMYSRSCTVQLGILSYLDLKLVDLIPRSDFQIRKNVQLTNNNAEVGPKIRTPTYLAGQMRFDSFFLLNTTYSP